MGENLSSHGADGKPLGVYPAVRENTIQSFQQAAKCGVGFVEFDVQVTRDNIPILWHDDDVVFGAADRPLRPQVKDLTLAELQTLCGCRNALQGGMSGFSGLFGGSDDGSSDHGGSDDGNSEHGFGFSEREPSSSLLRLFRDRATRQWTTRYEPWLCSEEDAIPTLEAVFRGVPAEVGFDIEIKMTTGENVVHTPAEEVDRMLNAILPVVNRLAAPASTQARASYTPAASAVMSFVEGGQMHQQQESRRIMFSSFDPDVCVELRKRQADYPVYYLSGCGLYEHADARRTSIPAALSFAAETGMRGIVVPASILLKNMDMVANAGRSQLELMTYGLENNDLDSLQAQADAGVVAAIVDEVAGVTAALGGCRDGERKSAAAGSSAGEVLAVEG